LPFLSGTEVIGLGTGCYTIGEFDRANEFAEQAEALFRNTESPYGLVMSHCLRAIVLLGRAQLGSAMQHLQRAEVCALADSGAYSYCCALARALQGVVRYLRFDLEGARQLLNHNLPLIVGCGWVEIWRLAAIFRARVFSAERMWSQAEESLRQSVSEQQGHWVRRSLPLVRDESVRILIQAGDLDAARNYAVSAGISLAVPLRPPERWEREKCLALRAQARLFLAEGQPGQALECVRSLRPLARASGRELRDLELAILEAVALRATGDVSGAMRRLAAAVNVAANDGIVAPFVEEGPMCLALLHELEKDARGSAIRAFLRQLTLAFGLAGITRDDNRAAVRPSSQLTKREVEVLEMLADGAENREISGQLGISEFTVKWHVRNILETFGASNRRKAVLTARKQGYLP
jgi:LuxR family maltose regulon positive regulatory protein